jgi:hypothetical protein
MTLRVYSRSLFTGSTPLLGGTDTRVLFNDGGFLGESSSLLFNKTTGLLTVDGGIRLGTADAAAPVSQSLTAQSVSSGTTNTAGVDVVFNGSRSTGNVAGGGFLFRSSPGGASGSSQNSLADLFHVQPVGSGHGVSVNIYRPGEAGARRLLFDLSAGGTTSARIITNWSSGSYVLELGSGASHWRISTAGVWQAMTDTGAIALGSSNDTILTRDSANIFAVRNGTAAQILRIYDSFTDASNYERLSVGVTGANVFGVLTGQAGTGTAQNLNVGTTGSATLSFVTNNTTKWFIDATGDLRAGTDNASDIGLVAGSRPRSIYVGTSVVVGTGGRLASGADGVVLLSNAAASDFARLQLGGTTSSFPSLKRVTTGIQARLADDSAFAVIQGKLTTDTAYTAGAPTPTGYLTLFDSNGNAYRVSAVAA